MHETLAQSFTNFDSWYRKLKIILEHERILYVLTDEALEESAVNAPHAMRDTLT